MKITHGTKVLITGGASGIGKLMGQIVLQKGAELIIWDINQENINETITALSKFGSISGYQVDVSNVEQVASTAESVIKKYGAVDLLINNAGIVVGKVFHEHSTQDITRTMNINAIAPMIIAQHFLPVMMKQKSGHICNIASSAGLTSNPGMSVYAASKWAVIGWSDSFRIEMQQLKTNIGVTTVTPYYINTGMFNGVRSSVIPILKPEKVARKIIRGIERNRLFVSMPWSVHFVRLSQGLLPFAVYDWFVGRVLGIYKTMEHFEGRKN
jgi:all-trans-retinol dehydrogenase (NAD+)